MVEQGPLQNPGEGRTVVHRGMHGEVVLSSSYREDTLKSMVKLLNDILKEKVLKGGAPSYVD